MLQGQYALSEGCRLDHLSVGCLLKRGLGFTRVACFVSECISVYRSVGP